MGTAMVATDRRRGGPEPRSRQGLVKASPGHREIVEIRFPEVDGQDRWLPDRIVGLIRVGVPRLSRDNQADGWWYRPGALPWWEVRQRVGGRVRTEVFAEAVEDLLAKGSLIELWTKMLGARPHGHVLMLPGHSDVLRWPIVRARALPEVLKRESWAQTLVRQ